MQVQWWGSGPCGNEADGVESCWLTAVTRLTGAAIVCRPPIQAPLTSSAPLRPQLTHTGRPHSAQRFDHSCCQTHTNSTVTGLTGQCFACTTTPPQHTPTTTGACCSSAVTFRLPMLGRVQRFLLSIPKSAPASLPSTRPQPLVALEHFHNDKIWPTLLVQSQLNPHHILHRIIEHDASQQQQQPSLYCFPTDFPHHSPTLPQHVTAAAYSRCVALLNATGRLSSFDCWWLQHGLAVCVALFFVTLALVLAAAVSQLPAVIGTACTAGVAWLLLCGVWDNVHRRSTLECNVRLHRTLQHVNRWLSKQQSGLQHDEDGANGSLSMDVDVDSECTMLRPCYIVACRVLSGVRHSLRGGVHEFYMRELIWMAVAAPNDSSGGSEHHHAHTSTAHTLNGQVVVALSRADSRASNRG